MNFWPRYSAHYVAKTLHLTMEQDGAFNRLLDWYYMNERPVPHASRYVIARATTGSEKRAVDAVLAEFFERDGAAWRNRRADNEIAEAAPRIAAAKANGRAGGRPRKNPEGTQEKPSGKPTGLADGEPSGKAPHSPFPISPTDTSARTGSSGEPGDDGVRASTDAGRACRLMREAGCLTTNPHHERLLEALALGITPEALGATAAEAIDGGHDVRKAFAYAIGTAIGRRLDPKPTGAAHAAPPRLSASEQVRAAVASGAGWDERDVIECEVRRLA